jgi:DNA-binding SARP family transcriptional activator/nucleoside-triphosphatase THEP1
MLQAVVDDGAGADDGRSEYRLFGGVRALLDGVDVDLGGPKPRSVLALLLLQPGRTVPVDSIIDAVWEGSPPERAEISLRGYVSNLRTALGGDSERIVWRDGGYALQASAATIDVHRFEESAEAGQHALRAGDAAQARTRLSDALALSVGRPLGSLADLAAMRDVVARLERRRRETEDALLDARLALGEHDSLIASLVAAVAAEPLSERRHARLALALYRSGRAVDALRSLEEARRVLAEEVGVSPGPELVDLEQAILDHEPRLAWLPRSGASEARPGADPERLFVGREREIGILVDAIAASGNAGQVVVVSGEAGVGKTALVSEAAERAGRADSVVWGRCSELAVNAAFHPWHAIASRIDAVAGGTDLASALTRRDDAGEPISGRLLVQAGVAAALRRAGRTVIVVDDLQWADEASLSLFELLADELLDLPLVVIATLRTPTTDMPQALVDCLGALARGHGFRRVDLVGLDVDELRALASRSVGPEIGERVSGFLHERTNGNPFFAREVLALLVAEGRAGEPAAAATDRSVPAAVHDVIRRRASRLPPSTQQVLSAAAVFGRAFDADVVAGVIEEADSDVLDALVPALDAGLLTADPVRPGRYLFAHALVGETFVAEQNPVRLARLHAAAARVLEARRPVDDSTIDALAYHAYEGASAGTAAAAAEYSARAAAIAVAGYAYRAAAAHLERALYALELAAPHDQPRRLQLLTDLGIALGNAGDMTRARAVLADAAELAERLGDFGAMAAALVQLNADDLWSSLDWSQHNPRTVQLIDRALDGVDPGDCAARAELLAAKAAELYYVDARDDADALSRAAVEMATRLAEPMTQARVLLQRYWVMWRPTGSAARIEAADSLVRLTRGGRLPPRFAPLAHLARFTTAYELGDATVADRSIQLARAAADPMHTPSAWSYVLYAEVSLHLVRGAFADAEKKIAELHEAFLRTRPFVAETTRHALLAQLRCEQGSTDEAVAHLEIFRDTAYAASISWLRAWILAEGGRTDDAAAELAAFDGPMPDDWYGFVVLTAAVHAAALSGAVDFLHRHLDELRPLAAFVACAGNGGVVLGPVSLALARAELALGNVDAARTYLDTAVKQAEGLRAEPWIARCLALGHDIERLPSDR